MSSNHQGVPGNGAWTPAITVQEPSDGDPANAASLNAAYSKLADFIGFLQANAAQLGGANAFSGSNTFNAVVTLSALLTLNSANLNLTAAVLQKILKTGGTLQVGTGDSNEVDILVNGAVKLALLAAGGIDAKSQNIVNLANPVNTQDAATKGYVDSAVTVTAGTNWSFPPGYPAGNARRTGSIVAVSFAVAAGAGASWAALGTMPVGARPPSAGGNGDINPTGYITHSGTTYPAIFGIAPSGTVSVLYYDNGTSMTTPPAIATNDLAYFTACYWAPN